MVLCKVFAPDKSHKRTRLPQKTDLQWWWMVRCDCASLTRKQRLTRWDACTKQIHTNMHKNTNSTLSTHTHTNQSFCHRTWERFKDASLTPIWRHLNSKTVEQQWERNLFHSGFSFIYSAYLPSGITTAGPGAAALFIQMEQRIIRLEPSNPEAWSHLCVSASACF